MATKKAFPLRINEDIWQAMRRWSDDELRSVNSQIEYLLRDALRKAGRLSQSGSEDGSEDEGKDAE
jgi:hypothetical protein